ncbi:MAG: hypothetical protein E6G01_07595 [Actinobacteria bacterium]|nr:MAG: hypothetical protein E6G01_07595 [Actinomycetota bacterium]
MTTFSGPPPETEGGIGPLTLGGFLGEVVQRYRQREAVAFRESGSAETVRWTYDELGREARGIGRALLAAGVGKGTRVGLLMGNRPQWVAAAYGVAMAGGVLVPVNTFYEPPELEHVLAHSDTAVLLLQEGLGRHAYLDQVRAMDGRLPHLRRVVCLGRGSWAAFSADAAKVTERQLDACAAGVSPFDDAIVIYTSGSTASPKGVLHSHRAPSLQSWRFVRHLCLDADDRVWSPYPLFGALRAGRIAGSARGREDHDSVRLATSDRRPGGPPRLERARPLGAAAHRVVHGLGPPSVRRAGGRVEPESGLRAHRDVHDPELPAGRHPDRDQDGQPGRGAARHARAHHRSSDRTTTAGRRRRRHSGQGNMPHEGLPQGRARGVLRP